MIFQLILLTGYQNHGRVNTKCVELNASKHFEFIVKQAYNPKTFNMFHDVQSRFGPL